MFYTRMLYHHQIFLSTSWVHDCEPKKSSNKASALPPGVEPMAIQPSLMVQLCGHVISTHMQDMPPVYLVSSPILRANRLSLICMLICGLLAWLLLSLMATALCYSIIISMLQLPCYHNLDNMLLLSKPTTLPFTH